MHRQSLKLLAIVGLAMPLASGANAQAPQDTHHYKPGKSAVSDPGFADTGDQGATASTEPIPRHRSPSPVGPSWKISYQLGYDRNARAFQKYPQFSKLPYPTQDAITRYLLKRITEAALRETKIPRVNLMFGPGGYKRFALSPSAQLDVRASLKQVRILEEAIGYLAHQNEVIASRPHKSGRKSAFQIMQTDGQEMRDPDFLQRFWSRLGRLSPLLQQGFLPIVHNGHPGIRIINTEDTWESDDYWQFVNIVHSLSREFQIRLASDQFQVDFDSVTNLWKAHADGAQYLDRLREQGQSRLANRLVQTYRPQVTRWLLAAFERYMSQPTRSAP